MNRFDRGKKRKFAAQNDSYASYEQIDTSKPSARFTPYPGGREWTVSVAIPGSILVDVPTADQRMISPGRIARALGVFNIDEVVVYDDSPADARAAAASLDPATQYSGDLDPCHFLAHIFSFLEAPPFMRRTLFPLHPNLRLSGLLPSLDMPHHPNMREWLPWREGVVAEGKGNGGKGSLVDVGLKELVSISEQIPPKTRVTLHFPPGEEVHSGTATPVDPKAPREQGGYYWGYDVRRCASLSAVFTESPFADGYDLSIGTSERGVPATKAFPYATPTVSSSASVSKPAPFKHLVIVFGGPRGLEYASMNDPDLQNIAGNKVKELFDHWINVLPNQGSRTIRTDEALFIALTALRRIWDSS